MNLLEFTLDDGRRVGIPRGTAILICKLGGEADPAHPKAKTLIRYTLGMNQARHAWVRDDYSHVLNLFPRSSAGLGWTHGRDAVGNDVTFPEGSINAYEELPKGEANGDEAVPVFRVSLNVETGPIELDLRASYEDILAMLGEIPAAGKDVPPKRRPPPARED